MRLCLLWKQRRIRRCGAAHRSPGVPVLMGRWSGCCIPSRTTCRRCRSPVGPCRAEAAKSLRQPVAGHTKVRGESLPPVRDTAATLAGWTATVGCSRRTLALERRKVSRRGAASAAVPAARVALQKKGTGAGMETGSQVPRSSARSAPGTGARPAGRRGNTHTQSVCELGSG